MEKVLRCDCGFEARAEHERGLVAEVQRHAREAHAMTLTPDEALLLAFRAELNDTTTLRRSVREAADGPEDGSSDRGEEK